MITIETCPKCRNPIVNEMIATFPPIPRKRCLHCGWYWEGEPEEVTYIPFYVETTFVTVNSSYLADNHIVYENKYGVYGTLHYSDNKND